MSKITQQEREDARHEMWVVSGGRDIAERHNITLADASIAVELADAGWRVLERELIDDHWNEIRLVQVVVRRGDTIRMLKWQPFNKGWMFRSAPGGCSGGWLIFDPTKN